MPPDPIDNSSKPATPYADSLLIAFANQSLAILFAGSLLDFGTVLQVTLICFVAFWAGVVVMVYRRPRNPTFADLLIIRWSFIPLVWVAYPVAMEVWHLRGLL
jgi:hypothetical protein